MILVDRTHLYKLIESVVNAHGNTISTEECCTLELQRSAIKAEVLAWKALNEYLNDPSKVPPV